jgi:hypothetical protein
MTDNSITFKIPGTDVIVGSPVNHSSPRKNEAFKWLAVAALAAATLLSCPASYAAQKTIEWLDDIQCSSKIRFDTRKYDEQRLRSTVAVIFGNRFNGEPFPHVLPDISLHPTGPLDQQIELLRQRCEEVINRATDLSVIDLPGIEAYRKLKLEELEDSCRFNQVLLRAQYGDVAALRSYTPSVAKCSSFIDALEGKTDLMEAWRGLRLPSCHTPDEAKANPAACPDLEGVKDMDNFRYDVLMYGWNNCSVHHNNIDTKRLEEMRTALEREFALRFKIRRALCSD